jgi:POT family proton-dependent oligopeptide transporter
MATRIDAAVQQDTSFFGHPRGLATLFFTEMWERFSYYGMRALLMLFMVNALHFDVAKASAIYGLYTSSVYLFSLPGGYIADRFLGARRAVLFGGVLIAIGQFCLMAPSISVFYLGLAIIVLGTGLLKPNVSTIVGMLYAPGDQRRDAGFSIFYMGINTGALVAPLLCGWVGQRVNWQMGFGLAGVFMALGVVQFMFGSRGLGNAGRTAPNPAPAGRGLGVAAAGIGAVAALGLIAYVSGIEITPTVIFNAFGIGLLLITIAIFTWLFVAPGFSPLERKRSAAILVLFLAACLFWSAFEQAGSSLTLFGERATYKNILGFDFPASWYQTVQPLSIVLFAPVFAWLWLRLGSREPSSPTKFAIGLINVGLGFAILIPAARMAGESGQVSPFWLIATYVLHTYGELSLSPVGLSAMTKLAPERVTGLMMGVWFLSISIGNYLGAQVASYYESFATSSIFTVVAGFCFAAAAVLFLLVKPTVRLMSGVK